MENFYHPLTDPCSRVARNIMARATRLANTGAVPGMTATDIAQDLREHLWRRNSGFDPARGSYDTFADRVIVNRIASLAKPTARLRAERNTICIDEPDPQQNDDEPLLLSETIAEADALHGEQGPAADEALGLVLDVQCLRAVLSPGCRVLADALMELTPTEAARELGLHRSTVYARLATIRAAALGLGLENYLRQAPTVSASDR